MDDSYLRPVSADERRRSRRRLTTYTAIILALVTGFTVLAALSA